METGSAEKEAKDGVRDQLLIGIHIRQGDTVRYRKKPVVVEAIQFDGINGNMLHHRFGSNVVSQMAGGSQYLVVYTLHGATMAVPGHWVVQGPGGDVWPVTPDIFAATYEPVDEETS